MIEKIASIVRHVVLNFLFPPLVVHYRLGSGGQPPTRKYSGDAGWDVYTSEDCTIPPQSFMDLKTALYVDLPDGVWLKITGRSSTFRTYGLRVENGIIDNGFTGELFVGVHNTTNKEVFIPKGTRLAQAIFFRLIPVGQWRYSPILRSKNRGDRGFGHSGRTKHQ